MIWHYPEFDIKRATRRFKCRDCERWIERGYLYVRAGHGRYCFPCARKYMKKEMKGGSNGKDRE